MTTVERFTITPSQANESETELPGLRIFSRTTHPELFDTEDRQDQDPFSLIVTDISCS